MLRVSRTKPLQKFLVAIVWGCELRRFEKMKNLVLVFLVPLISCRALLFDGDGKTFFYNISRARIYQILCGPCFEIHVSLDTTIPAHFLSFHIFLSFFPNQFLSCSKIPSVLYVSQLYPSHPFFQCKSSKKISFLCFTLLFTPFHLLYFIFFVATYRFCTEIHTPYSMVECMTRADILRIAWYHSILLCYYH